MSSAVQIKFIQLWTCPHSRLSIKFYLRINKWTSFKMMKFNSYFIDIFSIPSKGVVDMTSLFSWYSLVFLVGKQLNQVQRSPADRKLHRHSSCAEHPSSRAAGFVSLIHHSRSWNYFASRYRIELSRRT